MNVVQRIWTEVSKDMEHTITSMVSAIVCSGIIAGVVWILWNGSVLSGWLDFYTCWAIFGTIAIFAKFPLGKKENPSEE